MPTAKSATLSCISRAYDGSRLELVSELSSGELIPEPLQDVSFDDLPDDQVPVEVPPEQSLQVCFSLHRGFVLQKRFARAHLIITFKIILE